MIDAGISLIITGIGIMMLGIGLALKNQERDRSK